MKIKSSEIIAGFVTTILFIAVLGYVLDIPNVLPEIPKISEWIDKMKTSDDDSKSSTQSKKSTSSGNSTAKVVDTFKGVKVYYNGRVGNISGRNVTSDGYNLGLKYQCVEFVKRFYYEQYNHKMPNSYGNAKDFFKHSLADGAFNQDRGLYQYKNGSATKPKIGDLIVFGPTQWNEFGHVSIVSKVGRNTVEYVQQNPGPNNPSRETVTMETNNSYRLDHPYIIGWLSR